MFFLDEPMTRSQRERALLKLERAGARGDEFGYITPWTSYEGRDVKTHAAYRSDADWHAVCGIHFSMTGERHPSYDAVDCLRCLWMRDVVEPWISDRLTDGVGSGP